MAPSNLKKWLKDNGYWLWSKNTSKVSPTHVFLDGGKASVPISQRDKFMEMYVKDLTEGTLMYVVERSCLSSRMYADFDIKTELADPTDFMWNIINTSLDNIPDSLNHGTITICTRSVSEGKIGVHLIWKDLRVTSGQAMALRDEWVDRLQDMAIKDEDGIDWGCIIDAAVYKNNGLRMPYSFKRGGTSMYKPTHYYEDNHIQKYESGIETLTLLGDSMIFACVSPSDEFSEKLSDYAEASNKQAKKTRVRKTTDSSSMPLPSDCMSTLEFLNENGIGSSCKYTDNESILVSSMSHTCRIAERDHTSNHIYYEVFRDGRVMQKCHSDTCKNKGVLVKKIDDIDPWQRIIPETKRVKRKRKANTYPVSAADAANYWIKRLKK